MKKGNRRLLDICLVLAGIVILIALLIAPPGTTPPLPDNPTHRPLASLARQQGKKSAEAYCQDCHNPDRVRFPDNHPEGRRCLFCHRLPDRQNPGATAPGP